MFLLKTVKRIRSIWVTELTSHRGVTTTAPSQRTPATPAGTLTVPPPNNAGTTQRKVSANGRRLLAVSVMKLCFIILYIINTLLKIVTNVR